jgi:hypothetical protein
MLLLSYGARDTAAFRGGISDRGILLIATLFQCSITFILHYFCSLSYRAFHRGGASAFCMVAPAHFSPPLSVKGQCRALYRAVDKAGQTIAFLLTTQREREAALRFLQQVISPQSLPEAIITEI